MKKKFDVKKALSWDGNQLKRIIMWYISLDHADLEVGSWRDRGNISGGTTAAFHHSLVLAALSWKQKSWGIQLITRAITHLAIHPPSINSGYLCFTSPAVDWHPTISFPDCQDDEYFLQWGRAVDNYLFSRTGLKWSSAFTLYRKPPEAPDQCFFPASTSQEAKASWQGVLWEYWQSQVRSGADGRPIWIRTSPFTGYGAKKLI